MQHKRFDKTFVIISTLLVLTGFIVFLSAALGLLARSHVAVSTVILKQLIFGLVVGGIALLITANTHYRKWRDHAFLIFVFSLILTCLVFVPHIGFEHGGARRWIEIGPFSFQPAELLKIGYVMYFAAWLSGIKSEKNSFKFGILPFAIISSIAGAVLLLQPDTDGFMILVASGFAMLFAAGARIKEILTLCLIGLILIGGLIYTRPYLKERLTTFVNLNQADSLGAGYQIHQSLIAIGSGGLGGRGFGQSVQKFQFLPEPMGDSIFAVAAEEFGFLGSVFIILLFTAFAITGFKISASAPDMFGGLLALGIVVLIIFQSFINIASMLALFPLSGTPLVFVSQGGTALMIALAEVGILLNISKYQKKA